jgi:hypothetical protein
MVIPNLIGNPGTVWIPASAGMTVSGLFYIEYIPEIKEQSLEFKELFTLHFDI